MLGVWTVATACPSREAALFCVALAERLAVCGKRTLLLDLCAKRPSLDLALGVGERVLYTVSDVLDGRVSLTDALLSPPIKGKRREAVNDRIFLLPSEVDCALLSDPAVLKDAIAGFEADLVLLLTNGENGALACAVSDGVLLLTDGSEDGLRADACFAASLSPSALVLTHFVPTAEAVARVPSPRVLADALGTPLIGILPYSGARDATDAPARDFTVAAQNLACRLMGRQIPLLRGISIDGMRKRKYLER